MSTKIKKILRLSRDNYITILNQSYIFQTFGKNKTGIFLNSENKKSVLSKAEGQILWGGPGGSCTRYVACQRQSFNYMKLRALGSTNLLYQKYKNKKAREGLFCLTSNSITHSLYRLLCLYLSIADPNLLSRLFLYFYRYVNTRGQI